MSDDLIPKGAAAAGGPRSRRGLAVVLVAGLAVAGALLVWWLASDDESDNAPAASDVASAVPTSAIGSDTTSSTPTVLPEGPETSVVASTPNGSTAAPSTTPASVATSVPGGPTTAPSVDVDPQGAIDTLVDLGLTPAEAECVVDTAVAEYGSASVVVDPDAPAEVKEHLFEVTQDCLFG